MLFEEGQEPGQRYADGVRTWRQLFAGEYAVGVGQEQVGSRSARRFGKDGDGGAQLRNAACIAHLAGKFSESGNWLLTGLGKQARRTTTHTHGGAEQDPEAQEGAALHSVTSQV